MALAFVLGGRASGLGGVSRRSRSLRSCSISRFCSLTFSSVSLLWNRAARLSSSAWPSSLCTESAGLSGAAFLPLGPVAVGGERIVFLAGTVACACAGAGVGAFAGAGARA